MTDLPRKPKQEESERTESPPRTPAELRAYADRLEAVAQLEAQAAYDQALDARMVEVQRIRQAADVVERIGAMTTTREANIAAGGADVVPWPTRENETLSTRVHSVTTLDTMSSQETQKETRAPGMVGRKFTSRHPLPARAKALGKSIPAVAADVSKKLKRTIPRTTVRSWYAPKDSESARPIPEDAVKFFEAAPWGIPREAWKNGIKSAD